MTLPELARKAIKEYLNVGKIINPPKDLPKEFLEKKAGTFVSLHNKDSSLRGCIGTTEPTKENIAYEVINNAIAAAMRDPRFYPVGPGELAGLEISVDVLTDPEEYDDISKLNPKKYGVIVCAADGRKGLLLPDIDGIDTVDDQISICCQKANIFPDEDFEIYKFEVKRYH